MPEKHHYLPIFYQKRWAASDGLICVYSKPFNRVKALRRHPNAVGFKYDLYSIAHTSLETATYLERRFFLQTDNEAAQTLKKLENNDPLDIRLRSAWSRFVVSLIHRAPQEIEIFHREIAKHLEYLEKKFEQNYELQRRPTDPATFEEFRSNRPFNPGGIAAIMLIQAVIDSPRVGGHLNKMRWNVMSLQSTYPLLTSDRPIVMTNGMISPDSHLALPIGPTKVFLASNGNEIVDRLSTSDANALAALINDRVVKQAREFVIGVDDRQLRFVSNRFGAGLPSSPTETKSLPTPAELDALLAEKIQNG